MTLAILFYQELVEGNDHPKEIPEDDTDKFGKETGLLLRLAKSIYNTEGVWLNDIADGTRNKSDL